MISFYRSEVTAKTLIMDTQYYIAITLKTGDELKSFAKFFIGNNHEHAYRIFKHLRGSEKVSENNILYFEFLETRKGLPLNLDFISCTLDQLAENCRIITKELFTSENFERSE